MGNAWMKGERNQDLQTKRRLALMRLIREENHLNQQRIRNREEILYGKSDSYGYMLDGYEQEEPDAVYDGYGGYKPLTAAERERQAGGVQLSTFGLRLFLAALLFGVYFYGKTQDVSVAGIRMEQVESLVEGQEEQLLELLGSILNRTY